MRSKGGQSATNLYAYAQYLFGVAVVATIDLDTPDAHLVDPDSDRKSRWLLKNCVTIRLAPGECFYKVQEVPAAKVPNNFSLFAQTVRKRPGHSESLRGGQSVN